MKRHFQHKLTVVHLLQYAPFYPDDFNECIWVTLKEQIRDLQCNS